MTSERHQLESYSCSCDTHATRIVALFGIRARDFKASVHRCKQRPGSSAAMGFVFGRIGFVFDLVKSPIATRSCSNMNSLLILRLEQVFPSLASFGAFHDAPDCQTPPSRSGFSLTISPRRRVDGRTSSVRLCSRRAERKATMALSCTPIEKFPNPPGGSQPRAFCWLARPETAINEMTCLRPDGQRLKLAD